MKPFLKWAGGKYKIIQHLQAALPTGTRLIEPFVGSGAVYLNLPYQSYYLTDSNTDLINLFQYVQHEGTSFIQDSKLLFTPETNQETAFYTFREEFNSTTDPRRKAALFVYLNRHCYNGLCRYNSKGGFNVPFGRYKAPVFPEAEMLNFHQKSQHAEFKVADFSDTMQQAQIGDVVYCDPPYVPLTATANFTSYTQDGFDTHAQLKLAELAKTLQQRGVTVVISNHDTEFTREAYQGAEINAFSVRRFISSDANNRGTAAEILAIFRP